MFTGLVEATGTIRGREPAEQGIGLVIGSELAALLEAGDSVAVDGACLTVTEAAGERFRVDVVATTLEKTTLGGMDEGRSVNLERALCAGDRLGGHLVQGHVDAVGTVASVNRTGETVLLSVELPGPVARTTVLHGSLTLDGVSLTVAGLTGSVADVAIIPYTWEHTALDRLRPGDRVNLEADVLGKYVEKLLGPYLDRLDAPAGTDEIAE